MTLEEHLAASADALDRRRFLIEAKRPAKPLPIKRSGPAKQLGLAFGDEPKPPVRAKGRARLRSPE